MANDIRIRVSVDDDASSKLKNIGNTSGDVFGGMTRAALAFGAAFASAQVIGAVVSFGREIVTAASDASESLSKLRVVFGDQSKALEVFSADSAKAFGLSTRVTNEYLGTFGNLLTSMGLSQGASAGMSTNIVQLAADLASFNNLAGGVPEALEKIRAGLIGEAEPLRALGVNLNEASIQQEAMRLGILKTGETLSAGNKAQAAYSLILQQTKNAQGDYARTSDGLANTQRTLSAEVANLKEKMGVALLPAVTSVTTALAKMLDENGEKWANGFATGVNGLAFAFGKAIDGASKFLGVLTAVDRQGKSSLFSEFLQTITGINSIEATPRMQNLLLEALGPRFAGTDFERKKFFGSQGAPSGGFAVVNEEAAAAMAQNIYESATNSVVEGLANMASTGAAKIKTAAEKLADELTTIQDRFLSEQVEAYIKGGDLAVQATRKSQEQLLADAMVVAKHIADTYGVDISEVIGEAMQGLTKQADALKAATDAARRSTFDLTKQLWDMARGPGGQVSAQNATMFAGAAQQAGGMDKIAAAMIAQGVSPSAASDAINAANRAGTLANLGAMVGVTIVNNFNVPTNPTETATMITDMINAASTTTGPLIAAGAVAE